MLGRQALGSKAQLVVVETADARYVLGVTEHGVNLIERMPADHVRRPVVHSAEEDRRAPAASPARLSPFDQLLAEEAVSSSEVATARPSSIEASGGESTAAEPTLRRHRQRRSADAPSRPDPLRGSILSPETWRQTAEFMRRAR